VDRHGEETKFHGRPLDVLAARSATGCQQITKNTPATTRSEPPLTDP
jgi:hypothetical protein